MILVSALALQREASLPLAWREGQLCVAVTLDAGRPAWFLLDTGARSSIVTARVYARLLAGGAKPGEDGTITVPDAHLGELPISDLRFGQEEPRGSEPLEGSVDGRLGMDLLARYQVGLDLREKTLRLWPAGTSVDGWFTGPSEERLRLPLSERPEGWGVPLDVGNLTVPMVLDTGASETFVHTDVAALVQGAKKAKRDERTVPFYDGLHHVRALTVRSMGIGGVSLGQRTIRFASVPRMVGLLGRDLLSPLKVLLDYPGGQATFAGVEGARLPAENGPTVTLPNGVVVHWPLGAVATAPPGCAYTLPRGYREVFNRDESVDLVPSRVGS